MVWLGPDHQALLAFKARSGSPRLMVPLRCQELFGKDNLTSKKTELGILSNLTVQLVQSPCPGQRPDTAIY